MKRYVLITILSIVCLQDVYANHTKGGWMYYEYLGPGIADPSKLRYKIGLNLYIDCGSTLIEPTWNFSFFDGRPPFNFIQDITVNAAPDFSVPGCTSMSCYPCINNVPPRCYKIINYETIVELAPTPDGYIVSKQRCCRITGISNIVAPSQNTGATYTIKIPGTSQGATAPQNSSPKFFFNDTVVVCGNNPFSMNFTATDLESDSLSYSFVDAYDGGTTANPNPGTASTPPYSLIPYAPPFSGTQPLGALVGINPITGVISGIAPAPGEYVVCVLVKEYRNGVYIAEARKEIHLKVAPCTPIIANPNPDFTTCDGFTVNFFHTSSGANNVFWDFGDPTTLADTSLLDNPSYTYPTAGTYNITFIINKGQACTDTAHRTINVFPGFFPGFTTSPILCAGAAVQFTDTSRTNYGVVDTWRWNFGDLATLADTSHLQNPTYTYNPAGTYNVQFIVSNSKGCIDTLYKDILISDIPSLSLFPHDTAYCGLDSLQLTASGTGNFSWSPLTNIIGANTATPRVFPSTPTKYIVTLTNASGCINKDSLTVTPKLDLTNTAVASPANICAEDTLTLTGTSNYSSGISWQWNPAATVLNPTQAVTQAVPMVNTTYTLRTTWGAHCIATATVPVIVKALAIPNAGPDAFVCAGGQSSTQLNASGGNTYSWTPVTGLSNPNIANPIAAPTVPTYYVVAVGVNGCSKLKTDTVFVNVGTLPVISTLNDTLICNIDTLQLTTTGTGSFVWSPNYMISSTTVASPLVSPDVPTWYHVRLTDAIGCFSDDSVFVDVKDKVTLNAGPDTTICRTDGFKLTTTGDALHYIWTPNTYLSYDTLMRPFTRPLSSITYHVIGNIGKCQSDDYISIKVVPYPATNAGPDQIVCPGFPVQLNASGGSHYFWTPATFLTNRNIPNPVAVNPTANIQYIVTVTDTLGCPKPVSDTVWARVYPAVRADAGPSDTTVVEGEPLFLHASGGATYLWSPTTWLNDPNISNPVSLPLNNIKYVVEVTSLNGCRSADSINILLYKMDPDMYVPTAFTPNGNGVNDVLRPILLGMKSLIYFKVFNRFGEMVFSTTEIGKGWDGKIAGKGQDPGTFVWEAEGVTYKGVVKKKKGYAVLIRE